MNEHRERLDGVHPMVVAAVEAILPVIERTGHPMFVVEGVRTAERQKTLYAQGRTTPGAIVTNCDGVRHPSAHQSRNDGFGYAVDLAFQGADPWADAHPWIVYGALVKWLGLRWGGSFQAGFVDKPHMELR